MINSSMMILWRSRIKLVFIQMTDYLFTNSPTLFHSRIKVLLSARVANGTFSIMNVTRQKRKARCTIKLPRVSRILDDQLGNCVFRLSARRRTLFEQPSIAVARAGIVEEMRELRPASGRRIPSHELLARVPPRSLQKGGIFNTYRLRSRIASSTTAFVTRIGSLRFRSSSEALQFRAQYTEGDFSFPDVSFGLSQCSEFPSLLLVDYT